MPRASRPSPTTSTLLPFPLPLIPLPLLENKVPKYLFNSSPSSSPFAHLSPNIARVSRWNLFMCALRLPSCVNCLPTMPLCVSLRHPSKMHSYRGFRPWTPGSEELRFRFGRCPICRLSCVRRLPSCEKACRHDGTEHVYGFSPV